MKNYVVSALIIFSGVSSFAVQTLNQHQLRANIQDAMDLVGSDCEERDRKFASGDIISLLKEERGYSQDLAVSCNKEYFVATKKYCKMQKAIVSKMNQIVSDQNLAKLSEGFGGKPAASALGAVALYKMKEKLREAESLWRRHMNRQAQLSKCPALKSDQDMVNIMKVYTDKLIQDANQITLVIEE